VAASDAKSLRHGSVKEKNSSNTSKCQEKNTRQGVKGENS